MREKYRDSQEYLITWEKSFKDAKSEVENILKNALRNIREKGLDPDKYRIKYTNGNLKIEGPQREMIQGDLTMQDELELLLLDMFNNKIPKPNGNMNLNNGNANGNGRHKVINKNKLVKYMDEGWEIVEKINDEEYLIKRD
jgi:hypothetical protein